MSEYIRLGLSGCKLELINDKVIRKTSQSVSYNQRFGKQIEKQNTFFNLQIENIYAPKVLEVGYIDDLMYFDMEYVDSDIFIDTFQHSQFGDIAYYTELFFNFIDSTKSNGQLYTKTEVKSAIVSKLKALQPKSKYSSLINDVLLHVYSMDIPDVEKNFCHGDFTLSNILFKNKNVYFIDFLDSYIESFLIDLVKIKQDLYYKWNIKIMNNYSPKVEFYMNKMWMDFQKKYIEHIDTDLFHVLDLMNYLRIEPYVVTPHQNYVLEETIQSTKLYKKYKRK